MPMCENCQDHGLRITKLETDAEWMKEALDEIRTHTREVAGYAQQLVEVAHKTATMSDAVGRAFEEIEKERKERIENCKAMQQEVFPIIKGWEGVQETSRWVKTASIAVVGLVFVAVIGMVIK